MDLNLMKKSLTRLRLVNWHYFEDETVSFNGATLISGINASGKSTILDAIKMVLTVNTRNFNTAANENSKRDLMGYVRCKVGEDAKAYNREGVVISHVALEFFDEEKKKTFVLEVVHTSNDEQSQILSKWYIAECPLEDLNFLVGNRPATPKELRSGLLLLERKDARERFLARLGHLDEKFFDMIQKGIAFKPMKNVKEFIKNFLLPESNIDFESLKETINNVRKLEDLYNQCVKQKELLDFIVNTGNDYRAKQNEILVDEILLDLANYDIAKQKVRDVEERINRVGREITQKEESQSSLNSRLEALKDELNKVNDTLRDSDFGRLVLQLDNQIKLAQNQLGEERKSESRLKENLETLKIYLGLLKKSEHEFPITTQDFLNISSETVTLVEKEKILYCLVNSHQDLRDSIANTLFDLERQRKELNDKLVELDQTRKDLENRKHTYPPKASRLKSLVEAEFSRRGIDSTVCFLCELLEIKDESWRNAIEGLLNDRRFALVVDAKYFDVAFEVFRKNGIDASMLLNAEEILNVEAIFDSDSIAEYIECIGELATKYIALAAGNVHCCATSEELLNFEKSVAQDCSAYLDNTIQRFPRESYSTPFIGMKAYELQLENVKKEIALKKAKLDELKPRLDFASKLKIAAEKVDYGAIRANMDSPYQIVIIQKNMDDLKAQKKSAENNPDFIQLGETQKRIKNSISENEKEQKTIENRLIDLKADAKSFGEKLFNEKISQERITTICAEREEKEPAAYFEAVQKYAQHQKSKSSMVIVENFNRRLVALRGESEGKLKDLTRLQSNYNIQFASDIPEGMTAFNQYIDVQNRLRNVVIKERQNNLETARKQSEDIFKEDFLVKMRNMIRNARTQFKKLNDCLGNLAYGGDTYRFTITSNREKEAMYKMIMDDNNMGVNSLWSSSFEQTYKQELDDLYGKLLSDNDADNKIVQEYSDYRNYLDFDIKIHKPNGGEITYSKVVGEKSGAETQIPFYVAMAASFYILYQHNGAVRLILFDEAFEKMDESRIGTMMQFFKSLNLQTVLVTPPEKIESIGNHVDSVLAVCRENDTSYVMDYGYEKETAE